jgi:hypothetical protein
MLRYLLFLPDGEPNDPAVFVTAVPNWSVGETITLGAGEQLRVVAIEGEISGELVKHGFDGVFVVEEA